mmetsp:Transcript_18608/g.27592  ORF Transcript_18608/g.27592 Transcript_18608/m.27592 type:complete len:333 (-) Transcript_18608:12-1010(-)
MIVIVLSLFLTTHIAAAEIHDDWQAYCGFPNEDQPWPRTSSKVCSFASVNKKDCAEESYFGWFPLCTWRNDECIEAVDGGAHCAGLDSPEACDSAEWYAGYDSCAWYNPNSESLSPTSTQTAFPTTNFPSLIPTWFPSAVPSLQPSKAPTSSPTKIPSDFPSFIPTWFPSAIPTDFPTWPPTTKPTRPLTAFPTWPPTRKPTRLPTAFPSTNGPSSNPSRFPSVAPSVQHVIAPSSSPTMNPTDFPTFYPSESFTIFPTQGDDDTASSSPEKGSSNLGAVFAIVSAGAIASAFGVLISCCCCRCCACRRKQQQLSDVKTKKIQENNKFIETK